MKVMAVLDVSVSLGRQFRKAEISIPDLRVSSMWDQNMDVLFFSFLSPATTPHDGLLKVRVMCG